MTSKVQFAFGNFFSLLYSLARKFFQLPLLWACSNELWRWAWLPSKTEQNLWDWLCYFATVFPFTFHSRRRSEERRREDSGEHVVALYSSWAALLLQREHYFFPTNCIARSPIELYKDMRTSSSKIIRLVNLVQARSESFSKKSHKRCSSWL